MICFAPTCLSVSTTSALNLLCACAPGKKKNSTALPYRFRSDLPRGGIALILLNLPSQEVKRVFLSLRFLSVFVGFPLTFPWISGRI